MKIFDSFVSYLASLALPFVLAEQYDVGVLHLSTPSLQPHLQQRLAKFCPASCYLQQTTTGTTHHGICVNWSSQKHATRRVTELWMDPYLTAAEDEISSTNWRMMVDAGRNFPDLWMNPPTPEHLDCLCALRGTDTNSKKIITEDRQIIDRQ